MSESSSKSKSKKRKPDDSSKEKKSKSNNGDRMAKRAKTKSKSSKNKNSKKKGTWSAKRKLDIDKDKNKEDFKLHVILENFKNRSARRIAVDQNSNLDVITVQGLIRRPSKLLKVKNVFKNWLNKYRHLFILPQLGETKEDDSNSSDSISSSSSSSSSSISSIPSDSSGCLSRASPSSTTSTSSPLALLASLPSIERVTAPKALINFHNLSDDQKQMVLLDLRSNLNDQKNQVCYSGVNLFTLHMKDPLHSNLYATFQQVKTDMKSSIIKGSKSLPIRYFQARVSNLDQNGVEIKDVDRDVKPMKLKHSNVFSFPSMADEGEILRLRNIISYLNNHLGKIGDSLIMAEHLTTFLLFRFHIQEVIHDSTGDAYITWSTSDFRGNKDLPNHNSLNSLNNGNDNDNDNDNQEKNIKGSRSWISLKIHMRSPTSYTTVQGYYNHLFHMIHHVMHLTTTSNTTPGPVSSVESDVKSVKYSSNYQSLAPPGVEKMIFGCDHQIEKEVESELFAYLLLRECMISENDISSSTLEGHIDLGNFKCGTYDDLVTKLNDRSKKKRMKVEQLLDEACSKSSKLVDAILRDYYITPDQLMSATNNTIHIDGLLLIILSY